MPRLHLRFELDRVPLAGGNLLDASLELGRPALAGCELRAALLEVGDLLDASLELGRPALTRREFRAALLELGETLLVLGPHRVDWVDRRRLVGRLGRLLFRSPLAVRRRLLGDRGRRRLGRGLRFGLALSSPPSAVELGAQAGPKTLLGLELGGLFER